MSLQFFNRIENAALSLIVWSLLVLILLYVHRLPAMHKHKISLVKSAIKNTEEYRKEAEKMPLQAKQVAENYNHLMEQPTIFYAVVLYIAATSDVHYRNNATIRIEAWLYVALRIVHSLIQCFYNRVVLRFALFASASIVLMHIALSILAREITK